MKPWTVAAWIMILVCAALALLAQSARAEELHLLTPTAFSVEAYTVERNEDPYLTNVESYSYAPEYWSHGAAINWDVEWVRYRQVALYWDNRVHMMATNQQVRHVGWQWDLGVHLGRVDAFYWHHSQHALDYDPGMSYPLTDLYGVRFNFITPTR